MPVSSCNYEIGRAREGAQTDLLLVNEDLSKDIAAARKNAIKPFTNPCWRLHRFTDSIAVGHAESRTFLSACLFG